MKHPKLKDSHRLISEEFYPINEFPEQLIYKIGASLIYELYIGRNDIGGDDWGNIFAEAIGGEHLGSPVGLADVVKGNMAWSMKTVKNSNPFNAQNVRLISGRCSPDYSYGITDPHEDIDKTGHAVLGIWNERINIARDYYNPLRTAILIRSNDLLSYCLYEEETNRYDTSDYRWEENKNGNLVGKSDETNDICFTWQPHGSQFTIHSHVPKGAVYFKIKRPPILDKQKVLSSIGFDKSWVEIMR